MSRDFIADLLHYLYSQDAKEHPMSPEAQERLSQAISKAQNNQNTPHQTQTEGE